MTHTQFQVIWTIICGGPLILYLLFKERDKRRENDAE